jgi:hypothetical protein
MRFDRKETNMTDRYDIKTCADSGCTVSASYTPRRDDSGGWCKYADVQALLVTAYRAGLEEGHHRTVEGLFVCDPEDQEEIALDWIADINA